jgi:hypothetical protein
MCVSAHMALSHVVQVVHKGERVQQTANSARRMGRAKGAPAEGTRMQCSHPAKEHSTNVMHAINFCEGVRMCLWGTWRSFCRLLAAQACTPEEAFWPVAFCNRSARG